MKDPYGMELMQQCGMLANEVYQGCFRSVGSVPEGVRYFGILGIRQGVRGARPLIHNSQVGGLRPFPLRKCRGVLFLSMTKYLMSVSVRFGLEFVSVRLVLH